MIATTIDYQKLQDSCPIRIAISGCRSLSQSPGGRQFLRAGRGRNPQICRWSCRPICHSSRYINISGFGATYHFRLSVIVAITWRHFIRARYGRKSRTCRWNFNAICCSSSGITTSGFGDHIANFGCRSML